MNPKSVERPNMRTERCFVDEKLGENYSYLQKRRLLTKTDLSTDFAKVLSLSQQPTSKIEVLQKVDTQVAILSQNFVNQLFGL